jgi:hypothetical protein
LTLHPGGTFTDYNERLWDLKSGCVTEVHRVVYGGTYTLNLPRIQLYTKTISKVRAVIMVKDSLAAAAPLHEQIVTSGTVSVAGTLQAKQNPM